MRRSPVPVSLTFIVSIHASVKDATDEDGNAFKVDFVSIHASVKDATHAHDVSNPD